MKYRIYNQTEKSRAFGHPENEDRYMFSEYSFMDDNTTVKVLVVADGMGGLQNGAQAAHNAVTGFMRAFYAETMKKYMEAYNMEEYSLQYDIASVEHALIKSIMAANKEVCDQADPKIPTGATISAVCVMDGFAVCANVGDSPVYYYRKKNKRINRISKLHTKAERDVEAGLYERFSEEYYLNEHKIYCSLGQYNELSKEDIYVASVGHLEAGDIVLIGSDGAFGRMSEYEICELTDGCSEDEEGYIIEQMFDAARIDKNDDQTLMIYIIANED